DEGGRVRRDHHRDREGRSVLLCRGLPPAVPGQEPLRVLRNRAERHELPDRRGQDRRLTGQPCARLGARMTMEVSMPTSGADKTSRPRPERRRESLDEQARRRGIRPVMSVEDMARDDVFESDEELDAFLAWYHAERQANLA